MLAEDPAVPTARGHPVGVVMAMRLRHAIPLRLVGFADALNPWASYRNHPVVRTPGGLGMHPADPGRWGVLRVADQRPRHVCRNATVEFWPTEASASVRPSSSAVNGAPSSQVEIARGVSRSTHADGDAGAAGPLAHARESHGRFIQSWWR
jgi:hypothetical protein